VKNRLVETDKRGSNHYPAKSGGRNSAHM